METKLIADLIRRMEADLSTLKEELQLKPPRSPGDRGKAKVSVEGIDPATGEVKHRFSSQHAACAAGFEQSAISACLRGKAKSHGGLLWRRAAESA